MTRFDATEPAARRKLYVDAITAHRERGSGFLTLEADENALRADADAEAPAEFEPEEDTNGDRPELGVPWVQFSDGMINVDCTDEELDVLKTVLGEFPAFKIDELNRPEEADGVNVRISAKADPNRIAQFIDDVFCEVYELRSAFRVWVVEV